MAIELGLGEALLLGKGEDGSGGREKPSILADALEAVIGVVYLDGGLERRQRRWCCTCCESRITEAAIGPGGQDYKTRLQELAARRFEQPPRYEVVEDGPDHAKRFFATVRLDGERRGEGEGRSKKQAEQAAARDAWEQLRRDEARRSRCLSCPRSRPSGASSSARSSASASRRSRSPACGRSAVTRTRRSSSAALEGAKVKTARRRGKYLVLALDTGDVLVIHLRMSGQLRRAQPKDPMEKHTHVVHHLHAGRPAPLRRPPHVRRDVRHRARQPHRPRSPSSPTSASTPSTSRSPSPSSPAGCWAARTLKLKALLMDQTFIAGIGNIYSDEILWEAGPALGPHAAASSRTWRSAGCSGRSSRSSTTPSSTAGSTLADQQYVDLLGRPGEYQQFHNVYDRAGLACKRCRATIAREKFPGRSTFFCPSCQV